jgi:hypothetical protein
MTRCDAIRLLPCCAVLCDAPHDAAVRMTMTRRCGGGGGGDAATAVSGCERRGRAAAAAAAASITKLAAAHTAAARAPHAAARLGMGRSMRLRDGRMDGRMDGSPFTAELRRPASDSLSLPLHPSSGCAAVSAFTLQSLQAVCEGVEAPLSVCEATEPHEMRFTLSEPPRLSSRLPSVSLAFLILCLRVAGRA